MRFHPQEINYLPRIIRDFRRMPKNWQCRHRNANCVLRTLHVGIAATDHTMVWQLSFSNLELLFCLHKLELCSRPLAVFVYCFFFLLRRRFGVIVVSSTAERDVSYISLSQELPIIETLTSRIWNRVSSSFPVYTTYEYGTLLTLYSKWEDLKINSIFKIICITKRFESPKRSDIH